MTPRDSLFAFRPVVPADLPHIAGWLLQPHVLRWFGDPREWLDEIESEMGSGWLEHFVALGPDGPVGFAQRYGCGCAPAGPWSAEPPGTLGIDCLLGPPQLLGRGLGSRLLRGFIALTILQRGPRRIIADPQPAEHRLHPDA